MFCRLRFKCRLLEDALRFRMPFVDLFGIISQKNGSEKSFKKRPSTWKQRPIDMSGGSQRCRLTCALLKQDTTTRTQNAVRNCSHCTLPKKLGNAVWIDFRCKYSPKVLEECKGSMSKAHYSWVGTPSAKAWQIYISVNEFVRQVKKRQQNYEAL